VIDVRRIPLRVAAGIPALLILIAALPGPAREQDQSAKDSAAFRDVMAFAEKEHLQSLPIGKVMARVGRYFIGTPYVPHTLEQPGDESLVVNLREFDCTTFMENVLVLSRCIVAGKKAYAEYAAELQFVRYRGGAIDGYPSRLHYFTDWAFDNERKNVLKNISVNLGGAASGKKINFMSTHAGSYRQLADTSFGRRIAEFESEMNARGFSYVPRNRVRKVLPRLEAGDIIGTVTDMAGMDVAHTGLIVREKGIPRFLHAPLSGKKVLISDGSLAEYVGGLRGVSGVVVLRPSPPR
jgi:hypothetical protein